VTAAHRLLLGLAGAAAGRVALAAVEELARQPATARWRRPNSAGRPVTLLGGPAVAAVATLTAALGAPRGARAAALVAGAGAALAGRYDDLAGARPERVADKGLAGHLRALRAGRLPAGAVKAAGIGAAAAGAAALARPAGDPLLTAGLVAGAAHAVNLLDLRPGRAAKAVAAAAVAGLPGPAGGLVAGPLGAVAAELPADLGERVMLGDCGASALGALLGLRLALAPSAGARAGALAALAALTLAAERVSLSRVIAATPGLRELDRLGRRTA
jgi:UDP-N-acetylmuramyl pentapeptide phosphotransferase/UDP-N-acetylglucosamine-1-phosphate transferase